MTPGARRAAAAATGAAVAGLAAPPAAHAHGLVGRADLPIPEWLFVWGAAVVLIASFVALAALWPQPRLEGEPAARRLFTFPRVAEPLAGALGIALFVAVVYSGLAGSQAATANLAPTAVYVAFWTGLPVLSVLFGDVFAAINPWRAFARAAAWLASRARAGALPAPLRYPERLGRWPAALGIVAFAYAELVAPSGDDPSTIALLALVYAAIQLVGMSLFGITAWSSRGDAFGVYFGLLARLSPLRTRARVVERRRPLQGIATLEPIAGTVALLAAVIGTTVFDGFSEGPVWGDVAPWLQERFIDFGMSGPTALEAAFAVGVFACVLAVGAFYLAGAAGMRTVDRSFSTVDLARRFVHSLVPIALAYVVAHYFSLLAYQGQALGFLISDPLGDGSDLFGTAGSRIDYSVISATAIWYVQVGALVVGHVCGLVLAHDRALSTWRDPRAATRSQLWMLAVMVGFTCLGLWLLSEANG